MSMKKRHHGTSCLGSEWDQGGMIIIKDIYHSDFLTVGRKECSRR